MKFEINTIETERLIIRKFTIDDAKDFIDFRKQKELYTYMADHSHKTEEEHIKDLSRIIANYDDETNPSYIWAVALKESNKVIARLSIEKLYPKHNRIEIGGSLHPDYQGMGYAREFCLAFVNYLFSHKFLHRIHIYIWAGNHASRKLFRRVGFVFEGTHREARFKDGKYYNVWNYGLLRQDWQLIKKGKEARILKQIKVISKKKKKFSN